MTFTTLLADDFQGGGTRFWNRGLDEPFAVVKPKLGQLVTFPAKIEHEGLQVTNGTRILLIGFLSVDRIDPWTSKPTGLSWFASWGSLSWSTTKFSEGHRAAKFRLGASGEGKWSNNKYVRSLFYEMVQVLCKVGDLLSSHFVANLVDESKETIFLEALDEAYFKKETKQTSRASWFQGQQINLSIDGTVNSLWATRKIHEDRFQESEI